MTISNPASRFVTGNTQESFEYEGGSTLYHFSPRNNDLSKYMDMNIVFFANSEEHGLNILRRMLIFHILCVEKYSSHLGKIGRTTRFESFQKERKAVIDTASEYIFAIDNGNVLLTIAPTNQVYKVGWADNDTLMG